MGYEYPNGPTQLQKILFQSDLHSLHLGQNMES